MAPIRSRHAVFSLVTLIGARLSLLSFGIGETQDPLLLKHVQQIAELVDEDKDGLMSREEFIKYAKQFSLDNHGVEPESILHDLDKDGDQRISMGEIPPPEYEDETDKKREEAHDLKKFKIADVNKNGYLEGFEIVTFFHPPAKKEILQSEAFNRLRRMDTDKDNAVNLEEFLKEFDQVHMGIPKVRAEKELWFNLLDRDHDGGLSLRELMDYEAGHHEDLHAVHELFETADANKDGHLDTAEIHEAAEPLTHNQGHDLLAGWLGWLFGEDEEHGELPDEL